MLKATCATTACLNRTLKTSLAAGLLLGLASLSGCGGNDGGDFVANIGGTASGLTAGQSVVLQNNGNDDTLVVNQNGKFLFGRKLLLGQSYNVAVRTPPTSQVCQVSNGTGRVDDRSNDVLTVIVTCR
jgi:hypothetical protein